MKTYVQQWRGPADTRDDLGPCVVTIGRFDGVHLGHQRIFSRMRQEASDRSLPVVLVTVGLHPPLLCSARQESQLLAEQGVDAVWTIPLTPEFSRLDADDLVRRVLVNRLHATHVVVGKNFRFGHNAAGDLALLEQFGDKHGFTAVGVPLVVHAGKAVSSTGIRVKLAEGDVRGASYDLGRPHRVEGSAVRWYERSQMLDFPMTDVAAQSHTAIPAQGAYAGWLATINSTGDSSGGAEAHWWQAVITIGDDLAADTRRRRAMHAYVLDHGDLDLDVCGEDVAVDFVFRLRDPRNFLSIDRLARQIRKDAADARQMLIA
jgi:riboflavin kinase / FMN adenylyltransferase